MKILKNENAAVDIFVIWILVLMLMVVSIIIMYGIGFYVIPSHDWVCLVFSLIYCMATASVAAIFAFEGVRLLKEYK